MGMPVGVGKIIQGSPWAMPKSLTVDLDSMPTSIEVGDRVFLYISYTMPNRTAPFVDPGSGWVTGAGPAFLDVPPGFMVTGGSWRLAGKADYGEMWTTVFTGPDSVAASLTCDIEGLIDRNQLHDYILFPPTWAAQVAAVRDVEPGLLATVSFPGKLGQATSPQAYPYTGLLATRPLSRVSLVTCSAGDAGTPHPPEEFAWTDRASKETFLPQVRLVSPLFSSTWRASEAVSLPPGAKSDDSFAIVVSVTNHTGSNFILTNIRGETRSMSLYAGADFSCSWMVNYDEFPLTITNSHGALDPSDTWGLHVVTFSGLETDGFTGPYKPYVPYKETTWGNSGLTYTYLDSVIPGPPVNKLKLEPRSTGVVALTSIAHGSDLGTMIESNGWTEIYRSGHLDAGGVVLAEIKNSSYTDTSYYDFPLYQNSPSGGTFSYFSGHSNNARRGPFKWALSDIPFAAKGDILHSPFWYLPGGTVSPADMTGIMCVLGIGSGGIQIGSIGFS